MKSYSGPFLSALAAGQVVLVQLVHLDFPSGAIALNSSNWDLVWGGVTYKGAYGLGQVSPVNDVASGPMQGITLEIAAGDAATVSLALDGADEVQGTICTVRTAVLDSSTYQILDAPVDFSGPCDVMSISAETGTEVVRVSVESSAVDLLRGNQVTYSDADQQSMYPGDRAFEYVVDQADKPVVWPSREYFFQ